MGRRERCVLWTSFALVLLFSSAALAPPAAGQGFQFRPHFEVTETYESNINFSSRDPEADFYTTFRPGVAIRVPTRWFNVDLDYTYLYYLFARNSKYNRGFHLLSAEIDEEPLRFRNITVSFGDNLDPVPRYLGVPEDEPTNLVQRNEMWVQPVWRKKLSDRSYMDVGYRFSRVDYFDNEFNTDAGEGFFGHKFFTEVGRDFSPRFSLYQRNELTLRQYDSIEDLWGFEPTVGARAEPFRRLRIEVGGGYQVIGHMGTSSAATLSAKALYQLSKRMELEGRYTRRYTVDVEGDPYEEDAFLLEASYLLTPRAKLRCYGGYNRYVSVDDDGGEDDDYLSAGAGLDYRLTRRLYFNVGYTHFYNPGSDGYQNNRTYAGLRYAF